MVPLSEPPPLKSEPRSDGEDGAGAGSAAGIGAGFFIGALRLGAAFFLTFDAFLAIFFGAFFAADFLVFFFLRAGAAFFADFFFVFDFFAMIVLPIHAAYNIPSAPNGKPGSHYKLPTEPPFSPRSRTGV